MAVTTPDINRRVVLTGISWAKYESMLADAGDHPIRMTYDNGTLEIMSPAGIHELVKTVSARLIEAYCDEMEIQCEGMGSTTFRREELLKGLEPDECYFIQSVDATIGRRDWDPAIDPPPDIAIEVDITSGSIPRQPIYAALGVPELWRYDGKKMVPLLLSSAGKYVQASQSRALPNLPFDKFSQFIELGLAKGQFAAVRAMREWVRNRSSS